MPSENASAFVSLNSFAAFAPEGPVHSQSAERLKPEIMNAPLK